jgi:hypothetical protein
MQELCTGNGKKYSLYSFANFQITLVGTFSNVMVGAFLKPAHFPLMILSCLSTSGARYQRVLT